MDLMLDSGDGLAEPELDRRETVCRSIIESAARIAMEGFHQVAATHAVTMKGPQDYLTKYDGLVEEHIRGRLAEEFPEDGFLGEESEPRLAPRLWVVDPIDGTANFARGIPHFAISIAFVDQGRIELGGIANPSVSEMYFARRSKGATRNGKAISVASTLAMDRASVELGWSTRVPNAAYVRAFSALLATGANVRRAASGALGLAYVADGRSDAYAELHINAWDCLAGLLLVEEAGGRASPFLNSNGLLKGSPVLATTPGIADLMSAATGIPITGATTHPDPR